MTITATSMITVEWDTLTPASSQVWYNLVTPTTPITYTGSSSHTSYLPLFWTPLDTSYDFATTLVVTPTTHYTAVIAEIPPGKEVEFIVLSRHPLEASCLTEAYGPLMIPADLSSAR